MRELSKAVDKMMPFLLCDFYKISHKAMMAPGTEYTYHVWTCRGTRIEKIQKAVVAGRQGFEREYLIEYFDENFFGRDIEVVCAEYDLFITHCLFQVPDHSHIRELHALGSLPVEIYSLPEGTEVPMRVPMFSMMNTDPKFYWVCGSLETLTSCEIWPTITTASIAKLFRKILDRYAMETVGTTEGVQYQGHDFSFRGMSGVEHATKGGTGHLLSFKGTDTIPAIWYLMNYYGGNIENGNIGCSVPASEHLVQCLLMPSDGDETETIRRIIEDVYPGGIVSIVMDTLDFWKNVTEVLPKLKEKIMARDGKLVVRPDTGDPVDMICGTVQPVDFDTDPDSYPDSLEECMEEMSEYCMNNGTGHFIFEDELYLIKYATHEDEYGPYCHGEPTYCEKTVLTAPEKGLIEVLWDEFGGTMSEQGFKVLDSHVGAIYGDSITVDRCEQICARLKAKGFASVNIVLGIGSYTYNYVTRDSFNQCFKGVSSIIDGKDKMLFKDPKTGDGMKRSQRGMCIVYRDENGEITYKDGLTRAEWEASRDIDLMELTFRNSEQFKTYSHDEIYETLAD